MLRQIQCTKHGLVEGYFCRLCKAEKYVQAVKDGKIQPKQLTEYHRLENELLPLQIRFRAFVERNRRKDLGKAHSWEQKTRSVRIFPNVFLGGNGYET